MNRLFFLLFCVITSFTLSACVTSSKSTSPQTGQGLDEAVILEALRRAAIVVTGSPRLDPDKPSTISWLGSLGIAGSHQTLGPDELRQHLVQAINRQIMAKGYPLVSDGGDFQLDGVVVLAGAEDENSLLRESGGIDPGLPAVGDESHLGKGTLVLELKQGRVTRWKGTAQIYIAPDFDQSMAMQRIEYVVAQLLRTWP